MKAVPSSSEPWLLLIEDNPDDAELAKRALRAAGTPARLETADSVNSAFEILSKPSNTLPSAIFVDLNMPGKNGFDFLRHLRASKPTQFVPAVVLTTSNTAADVEQSYRLGANGFVTKPIDFSEFMEVFATMSRYWLGINQIVR